MIYSKQGLLRSRQGLHFYVEFKVYNVKNNYYLLIIFYNLSALDIWLTLIFTETLQSKELFVHFAADGESKS